MALGADLGLVVRTVQVQHRLVHQPLFAGLVPDELGAELIDHVQHALTDALPSIASPSRSSHRFEGPG